MPNNRLKLKKIGLLGGTFDPVHYGHLRVGQEVLNRFDLDCLKFLPARIPPHKIGRSFTAISHRLAMLKLATDSNPQFDVSESEARRKDVSYLVDTLRDYRDRYPPEVSIFFIMGMDSYLEISTWHHYAELFNYAHFIITTRPGFKQIDLECLFSSEVASTFRVEPGHIEHQSGHRIYFLDTTLLDISASMIRYKIHAGESIRYLLPDKVLDYIHKHNLYLDS